MYALDRQSEPSADFGRVATRAASELGTSLHYRQVDVRDPESLNAIVAEIATKHGRIDGLLAAAGIQQETPALDYTAEDANRMLEVNVTGCFLTAQAVARQMVKLGTGGSMVLIASMSGTIANRVSEAIFLTLYISHQLHSGLFSIWRAKLRNIQLLSLFPLRLHTFVPTITIFN